MLKINEMIDTFTNPPKSKNHIPNGFDKNNECNSVLILNKKY